MLERGDRHRQTVANGVEEVPSRPAERAAISQDARTVGVRESICEIE
jgi:hypothetical protein